MKGMKSWLMLVPVILLMTGCSRGPKSSEMKTDGNIIYVTRERTVSSALIYTSDKQNANYSQEELQADVEAVVNEYNGLHGGGAETAGTLPVTLKSCTLEGNTGNLVFDYRSAADFVEFSAATGDDTHTVTRMTVDSAAQAQANGLLADVNMIKPDRSSVSRDEIAGQPDSTVVVFDGAGTIQTQGTIMYICDDAELLNEFTARLPEGTHQIVFK